MRILVTGASGRLGSTVLARLAQSPHEVLAWSGSRTGTQRGIELQPVDLVEERAVANALERADPAVVIHAAAMSSVDAVYRDPARGWAVNVLATERLAAWAGRRGRRFVFTSTDLVFDGSRAWYREEDRALPVIEYGRSKHAAEQRVLATRGGLVARLSLLYGPSCNGQEGFFERALDGLRAGNPQSFFSDEFRTPLSYTSAAEILVCLALSDIEGVIHVAGLDRLSRFELMGRAALALGIDPSLVRSNVRAQTPSDEPRPADVSLSTERLQQLLPHVERPSVETALAALMRSE
jgi:dTDP-4-dehydrorhamnose reductase